MSVTTPGPDPKCYCAGCKKTRARRKRHYEKHRHEIIRKNVARKQLRRRTADGDAALDAKALKSLQQWQNPTKKDIRFA